MVHYLTLTSSFQPARYNSHFFRYTYLGESYTQILISENNMLKEVYYTVSNELKSKGSRNCYFILMTVSINIILLFNESLYECNSNEL